MRRSGNILDNGFALVFIVSAIVVISVMPMLAIAISDGEAYFDTDGDYAYGLEEEPTIIWQGDVTLINGTTFEFAACNEPYNTYEVNATTGMGALDATGLTYNASDEWYVTYGSFLLESIAGIANEPWAPDSKSWAIFVNDAPAPMGLSGNDLVDGDNVKFYFLPWDPVTYEPLAEQATYLVNINVTVQEVLFDGTVTVTEGTTFEFAACNEPYNTYEVNATTGMGALDATGLTYNASDEWYVTYGSFLLESIAGIANEPWAPDSKSWAIFVNDAPAPMGLSGNDLVDGDNVKFYFLPWDPVTYEPLAEQATYLVNINVTVQEVLFDGTVTVTEGTTFEFAACNEPYNTYEVNATTGMGALDATGLTYNASDEWYVTYGSFLLESIAGIANEPWAPDSKSWAIFVNDAPAPMGLSGNDLVDGDNVKFYFLPWDPVTYEPLAEQATYLVNINVTVQEVLFDGTVTVTEGTTFEFAACNEPYNTYEVNATTGMGALDATGLTYNASDEWYVTYGSFLLESIAGIANEPWAPDSKSWAIFVNDAPAPMGLSGNDLVDGDNVKFYFLPWDPVTYEPLAEQATYLVNINVSVSPPPPPPTPTPRPHRGGGGVPRDSDHDGYSDVEELLAGTNQNDPNDYPGKPAVAPTPRATPTPSTIVITPTLTPVPTPMTTPTPIPATPTPEEPGFEAFFAIAGLITVAYLVLRRKRE